MPAKLAGKFNLNAVPLASAADQTRSENNDNQKPKKSGTEATTTTFSLSPQVSDDYSTSAKNTREKPSTSKTSKPEPAGSSSHNHTHHHPPHHHKSSSLSATATTTTTSDWKPNEEYELAKNVKRISLEKPNTYVVRKTVSEEVKAQRELQHFNTKSKHPAVLQYSKFAPIFSGTGTMTGAHIFMEFANNKTLFEVMRSLGSMFAIERYRIISSSPSPDSEETRERLADAVRQHSRTRELLAKSVSRQVLDGLLYYRAVHDRWHRDVKPQNLLSRTGGDFKLADFDVSRKAGSGLILQNNQNSTTTPSASPSSSRRQGGMNHNNNNNVGCDTIISGDCGMTGPNAPSLSKLIHGDNSDLIHLISGGSGGGVDAAKTCQGTDSYMAPEYNRLIVEGHSFDVDPGVADVWSLGCVVFEILNDVDFDKEFQIKLKLVDGLRLKRLKKLGIEIPNHKEFVAQPGNVAQLFLSPEIRAKITTDSSSPSTFTLDEATRLQIEHEVEKDLFKEMCIGKSPFVGRNFIFNPPRWEEVADMEKKYFSEFIEDSNENNNNNNVKIKNPTCIVHDYQLRALVRRCLVFHPEQRASLAEAAAITQLFDENIPSASSPSSSTSSLHAMTQQPQNHQNTVFPNSPSHENHSLLQEISKITTPLTSCFVNVADSTLASSRNELAVSSSSSPTHTNNNNSFSSIISTPSTQDHFELYGNLFGYTKNVLSKELADEITNQIESATAANEPSEMLSLSLDEKAKRGKDKAAALLLLHPLSTLLNRVQVVKDEENRDEESSDQKRQQRNAKIFVEIATKIKLIRNALVAEMTTLKKVLNETKLANLPYILEREHLVQNRIQLRNNNNNNNSNNALDSTTTNNITNTEEGDENNNNNNSYNNLSLPNDMMYFASAKSAEDITLMRNNNNNNHQPAMNQNDNNNGGGTVPAQASNRVIVSSMSANCLCDQRLHSSAVLTNTTNNGNDDDCDDEANENCAESNSNNSQRRITTDVAGFATPRSNVNNNNNSTNHLLATPCSANGKSENQNDDDYQEPDNNINNNANSATSPRKQNSLYSNNRNSTFHLSDSVSSFASTTTTSTTTAPSAMATTANSQGSPVTKNETNNNKNNNNADELLFLANQAIKTSLLQFPAVHPTMPIYYFGKDQEYQVQQQQEQAARNNKSNRNNNNNNNKQQSSASRSQSSSKINNEQINVTGNGNNNNDEDDEKDNNNETNQSASSPPSSVNISTSASDKQRTFERMKQLAKEIGISSGSLKQAQEAPEKEMQHLTEELLLMKAVRNTVADAMREVWKLRMAPVVAVAKKEIVSRIQKFQESEKKRDSERHHKIKQQQQQQQK